MSDEVLCACGCGKPVSRALQNFPERGYKKGDYFRYARGHHESRPAWNKGQHKERVEVRTARARAHALKAEGTCELERIGGCSTWIEVHHIDGDPQNNAFTNLMRLCRAHHSLIEKGRIDLDNPVMPRFVIRSDKRRYEGTYPAGATFWPDAT